MLQNYMGMSFTEIVRGIKMTRAEEYLSTSTLRIHDISALVGYDSVDHFSRTFKSTHNMSPQAYRRLTTKRGLRTLAASAVKGESAEKERKDGEGIIPGKKRSGRTLSFRIFCLCGSMRRRGACEITSQIRPAKSYIARRPRRCIRGRCRGAG